MRIALIPLDSRPPNWQFPQRLADIAGVELAVPPRGELGTLHSGADGLRLAQWLCDTVSGADGRGGCIAAVFSWDALLYGGLVQSRRPALTPHSVADISAVLARIDWQRCWGYSYLTIPRLGISLDSVDSLATHRAVREYFILGAQESRTSETASRLRELECELGERAVRQLWQWRARNQSLSLAALDAAYRLGLRRLHAAMEDNAPTGPHLREAAELSARAVELASAHEPWSMQFSLFDGADECACLLLARAVTDLKQSPPRPLQLIVHPSVPGPDRYTGLYESRSLGDGLTFLASLLHLDYHYSAAGLCWLITHGVQPQPDIFEADPTQVFRNPYLLPRELPPSAVAPGNLLLASDLAACNGANPFLVDHLAAQQPQRACGVIGFNTNFNTLGVSAALLRLVDDQCDTVALRRFLLERLADDVVYQSLARPRVLAALRDMRRDALDFAAVGYSELTRLHSAVQHTWREWCAGRGAAVLAACGIPPARAAAVRFDFPWLRAFEIEATAPES